ncbi:hypothetical protein IIW29_02295 [Candidatus Saccharibacteria bacterium]|nr:hypothetical protein [Candidatus Saccharibacteria bacterium]
MDNINGMNGASGMPGAPGIPQVQPMVQAGVSVSSGVPGQMMVQQAPEVALPKKDMSGLIKTIVIIILSLVAATFIGLFIWMAMNYQEAQTDLDTKVAVAVAEAKDEQAMELENDFLEREKYPYKTFSGPADYGQLTFEYPKTWSVYVAQSAASSDGNFNAYFNPIQVDAVGDDTVNALRVTIRDESFDEVTEEYQHEMERDDSGLTMATTTIGKNNNITANRYTGVIPNTEDLVGYVVTFKIRDKTAVLQTDSVLFEEDFNKLLGTVIFNE